MTRNKPADKRKGSCDGDSPFTGCRAENASEMELPEGLIWLL